MRRLGIEVELLAPHGRSRQHLAEAMARAIGGSVLHGFRYQSGPGSPARHLAMMTPAFRVVDPMGNAVGEVGDDVTLSQPQEEPSPGGMSVRPTLFMDDIRLALWVERRCWSESSDLEKVIAPLIETFHATLDPSAPEGLDGDVVDPWGNKLAAFRRIGADRMRTTEWVSAPMDISVRQELLEWTFTVAREAGFVPAREGAIHLHYDRDPFRSPPVLCRLVRMYAERREQLLEVLEPNSACTRIGPFPDRVVAMAKRLEHSSISMADFGSAMFEAGVVRDLDINIIHVLLDRPRHPTIEVRCLPSDLDVSRLFHRISSVEAFLSDVLSPLS
jgi:hypothetical protein